MNRSTITALAVLTCMFLVACGGGGGGGDDGGGGGGGGADSILTGQVLIDEPTSTSLTRQPLLAGPDARARLPVASICRCGEAIVWTAPGVGIDAAVDAVRATTGHAVVVRRPLGDGDHWLLAGGPTTEADTRAWIAELAGLPQIARAEANELLGVVGVPVTSTTPNDPVSKQHSWNLDMIRLGRAWAITRGDAAVVVAVVDTGVGVAGRPHPDLEDQVLDGIDFVDGDTDAEDEPLSGRGSHGTHVAGTIAALANNGRGVAGIAPGVRILPVRALGSDGFGTVAAIADGVRWAAGLSVPGAPANGNPAQVINLSLGGGVESTTIRDAIIAATNAGVVVVAAAGNDEGGLVRYPAAQPETIAVSAVGPSGEIAGYSNFGNEIDVAAPGGEGPPSSAMVWSTDYLTQGGGFVAGYAAANGTSMATPHVAATAALMLSVNPQLTPASVRSILASTAVDVGVPGRDQEYGDGLIDAGEAVRRAEELAGGSSDPGPRQLIARTSVVRLTPSTPQRTVRLANAGEGSIAIAAATAYEIVDGSPVAGPAWLSAQVVDGSVTSSSDGAVQIDAIAAQAGAGARSGLVVVESDAGDLEIPVQWSNEPTADVGTVIVRALDAFSGEIVAETTTDVSVSYVYRLDVPAGTYYVTALVDENEDGEALRADEWAGDYPTTDRQAVSIGSGFLVSGLDIPIRQLAEEIQTGTGGGAPAGVLAAIVRSEETGLPIEGATISIGDGGIEETTDSRGIAIVSGVNGAQTITAAAPGHDAVTYLDLAASRIGFSLRPTRTPGSGRTMVRVTLDNLFAGEVAYLMTGFGGFTQLSYAAYGATPTVDVEVEGPTVLSAVLHDIVGSTVAIGYGEVTPELLARPSPALTIPIFTLPASPNLAVNVSGSHASLDRFWIMPAVLGATTGQAAYVGFDWRSGAGTMSSRLYVPFEIEQVPATVMIFGYDDASGRASVRLVTRDAGELPGASIATALPAAVTPLTPSPGGSLAEGDRITFAAGAAGDFGEVELTGQLSGFVWEIKFGAGVDSVRVPRLGLLGSEAHTTQIRVLTSPTATYETLSDLPASLRDGMAALDLYLLSEEYTLNVP
jgi:subtilisin family serine protease